MVAGEGNEVSEVRRGRWGVEEFSHRRMDVEGFWQNLREVEVKENEVDNYRGFGVKGTAGDTHHGQVSMNHVRDPVCHNADHKCLSPTEEDSHGRVRTSRNDRHERRDRGVDVGHGGRSDLCDYRVEKWKFFGEDDAWGWLNGICPTV